MKKGETPAQNRINKDFFETLCKLQCTEEEIAGHFKVDVDTLVAWCKKTYGKTFSDTFKIYSVDGKISLRRNMFKQAEKNAGMAIWLSKQYLGMTDKVEYTDNSKINEQIVNIANLINKPKKERKISDFDE